MQLRMVFVAVGCALAQEHSTTSNPYNTPGDREAGAKLFRTQCAACHGAAGIGGSGGPELLTGTFRHGSSDEALCKTVMKGIPGTAMPAFPGNPREAWQIVSYVRGLSEGRAGAKATGDPSRGHTLFRRHGCLGCHAVDAEGGSGGPDLSNVGLLRSLAHLRRSIVAPDEHVSPEYWTVTGRTKSGESIAGLRLNEDTFSYQLADKSGLRSVLKSDLVDHRTVSTSTMPSYEGKLSQTELEDLLAFLAARQKAGNR